jgi:hypothetical protein
MFDGANTVAWLRHPAGQHQDCEEVGMTERSLDEPDADVAEQNQEVVSLDDDLDQEDLPEEVPLEADLADAADQAREVGLGEDDDYR